jgi:hypothetical protein
MEAADIIEGFHWLTFEGGKFSAPRARHLRRCGAKIARRSLALVADRQPPRAPTPISRFHVSPLT